MDPSGTLELYFPRLAGLMGMEEHCTSDCTYTILYIYFSVCWGGIDNEISLYIWIYLKTISRTVQLVAGALGIELNDSIHHPYMEKMLNPFAVCPFFLFFTHALKFLAWKWITHLIQYIYIFIKTENLLNKKIIVYLHNICTNDIKLFSK